MIHKEDDLVGSLLHDVAHLIRQRIDHAVRAEGLTRVVWLAIGLITQNPKMSQAELAIRLELGQATTGRLVDRLEQRGLVQRQADPQDRRTHRLTTTPAAQKLLGQMAPLANSLREEVLQDLDDTERAALTRSLEKIKARLCSMS